MPVPSKERRTFLESARKTYQEALTEDAFAVDYLTTTRGLSWDSVTYFRLGVVGDPLPGHEAYKGMLAIPYIAPNGDTLSIRFRNLRDNGPKYLTLPGDKPRPYNTAAIERYTSAMWITEGEIDSITLHEVGVPAIGIPGANTWRNDWALIFKPYQEVLIPVDGDDAGHKFGRGIAEQLENARVIDMGTYIDDNGEERSHDVNSFFVMHGQEALLRKVGA
ncbi:toprim domain-containing protein [Nonomuraea recticatena]|uniref:DNA primase n=1 Tax=Nonomuraea recticatena TaxID=46178 RepID=A0ABN3SWE7_9ACTN